MSINVHRENKDLKKRNIKGIKEVLCNIWALLIRDALRGKFENGR